MPNWDDQRERRLDPDRGGWLRDAGAAGYDRPHTAAEDRARYGRPRMDYDDERRVYRGQEYGIESRHDVDHPDDRLIRRRPGFDYDDPGVGQSQAGYGAAAQSHLDSGDRDLEPDYLRWRDQQLRDHDRAYEAWRRAQREHYDRQYRQFRAGGR